MVQSWNNPYGPYQKFGPDKATPKKAGEYVTTGGMREIEVRLDLTDLTETETIVDDTVFIPAGVRLHEVEVITTTAAATGAAIDVGTIKTDRSTEIDYDGLLAAFPTASMNADGEVNSVVIGHTYVGADIGTTTAYKGYITASRTTSTAFTAGEVVLKIRFYVP